MVSVFILFSLYVCVYYVLEGKLINIWMCGCDNHLIFTLCVVFYSSSEFKLGFYYCEHDNDYFWVMYRCFHWINIKELWSLPMYPNVNAWIAKVRNLKCNMKLACIGCYYLLCGQCLFVNCVHKRVDASMCCWYPLCDHIDQCTHTLTLHACLNVV